MTARVLVATAAVGIVVLGVGTTAVGAARAVKTFTVTAAISKHSIILGRAVLITGTVSPTYPGQKVHLRRLVGRTWQTIATHNVTNGRYRFRPAPTHAGTWAYRVTTDAHRARRGAHSPTLRVEVYRWHNLADMTPVAGRWHTGIAEINGKNYPHSLVDTGGSAPVGYNLARSCTQLTGVAGMRDDSGADDYYQFQIEAEDSTLNSILLQVTLDLGADQPFTINVINVLRLSFSATFLSGPQSSPDIPAFGSPRVLCRF